MSNSGLDFEATTQTDLVTGKSPWGGHATYPASAPLTESFLTGIAIIGGGITGSLAAEHLTALGHQVTIIDREPAGRGSTAASIAMLQWEIDAPLAERSLAAVAGLGKLVESHALPCHFAARQTLYLAAGEVTFARLLEEHGLRQRQACPERFSTTPRCAANSALTAKRPSIQKDLPRPILCSCHGHYSIWRYRVVPD